MDSRKLLSLGVGLIALAGVVTASVWSAHKKSTPPPAPVDLVTVVKVLTGSEKLPLLSDPRFAAAMARQGLQVEARKAGSREIATRTDLASFDVAFPAGQPAAAKIRATVKGAKAAESLLVSPLAIATWAPLADVLKSNGLVREEAGALWVVDMERLLDLMAKGMRWKDLPGNKSFAVGKSVLVSTTDVRTSNSAAQFLALASYLLNDRNVVADSATAVAMADKVAPFFAKQGFQEASSAGPFEDYLVLGMGKVPMVWIYESQFLEQALKDSLRPDMVLLYPLPTVFTKHVAVALSDTGLRFIAAMKDPQVQAIAADYGFRAEGSAHLSDKLKAKGRALPRILDVADAPSHDLLEQMTMEVAKQLDR